MPITTNRHSSAGLLAKNWRGGMMTSGCLAENDSRRQLKSKNTPSKNKKEKKNGCKQLTFCTIIRFKMYFHSFSWTRTRRIVMKGLNLFILVTPVDWSIKFAPIQSPLPRDCSHIHPPFWFNSAGELEYAGHGWRRENKNKNEPSLEKSAVTKFLCASPAFCEVLNLQLLTSV